MLASKSTFRKLYRELLKQNERIFKLHSKDIEKKQLALFQYQKINLIKLGKSLEEAEEILKARKKASAIKAPKVEIAEFKAALESEDLTHLIKVADIAENFLRSQRVYQELVERYNPGMTMSQEESVKRTANKVGLLVPSD